MPSRTFTHLPQEKQNRILEIAAAEFAAHPYDSASISEITRQAGIAKGSFYQYFEDKQDLYRTLINLGTETKLKLLAELPAPDPASDLFDYLKWQLSSTAMFEVRYPDLAGVLFRAFVEEVPFPEMTEELRRRGTTQFFKQLISQGLAHGDVAVWVDPDTAAFLMESVFYQFGRYLARRLDLIQAENDALWNQQNETVQLVVDSLMDLVEAGMKRNPRQREEYFSKD